MSSQTANIELFNGFMCKYYCVANDKTKYHCQFPISWAVSHEPETGPNECANCNVHGSIDGIFVGYCSNCLTILKGDKWRGNSVYNTYTASQLTTQQLWQKYPYMTGAFPHKIADKHMVKIQYFEDTNYLETMNPEIGYINLVDEEIDDDSWLYCENNCYR